MTGPTIMWFRRDLRLGDNPALTEAARSGPVLPVFIVDDRLWATAGDVRRAFLVDSLRVLRADTEGALLVRTAAGSDSMSTPGGGASTAVGATEAGSDAVARALVDLADEIGAERVVASEDFGPYGRSRDEGIAAGLTEIGLPVSFVDSPYAVKPGSILTGGGTPYRVFTPFFRAWKAHGWAPPSAAPAVQWSTDADPGPLPDRPRTDIELPPAGEAAALDRLESFLADGARSYDDRRDLPAVDGTSRLSPYLKWGAVHPRTVLDRLDPDPSSADGAGHEVFRSEICWREFYAEVLFQRPDSARAAYVDKMAGMEVDTGVDADRRFEAWAEGRTGYPIVDAGMRQLRAEGWMHNRVRMIAASFLVKDLHLDWTRGARLFMDLLVDGDLASNNHGWQWVAGTGTDASPYFRIFNPVSQSRKFDPEGDYLRRWIPEIAHLGDKTIHEPWTEKAGPPAAYPAPIVDHGEERAESLRRYERLKAGWDR